MAALMTDVCQDRTYHIAKGGILCLYISAWAFTLLVQLYWAMRRPRFVERVTESFHAFLYIHRRKHIAQPVKFQPNNIQQTTLCTQPKTKYTDMKKRLFTLGTAILALASSIAFTACSKDDSEKDNPEKPTVYRYWKAYPQSYIKMCDWRMTFRFTECKRVDGGLYLQYTLTNTGFDEKVQISFWMPEAAAHDDLGNTYKCAQTSQYSDVEALLDGKRYSIYGLGQDITFMPNQAIKGCFTIKGFDPNATAVSVSCNTRLSKPAGQSLMYDHIEFVNMPLDCNPDTLVHM